MKLNPETRRAQKAAKTRQTIVGAAAGLFKVQGYEPVTMRDIAAEAGVSTGAIFSHFTGKEDLFKAAIGRDCPPVAILTLLNDVASGPSGLPALSEAAEQLLGDILGAAYHTAAAREQAA